MILHPPKAQTGASTGPVSSEIEFESASDIYGLLAQAAEMAAKAGLPAEAFTAAAWQAFMGASPAFAEHVAELQFDAAVEELRKSGRLAKA